MRSLPSEAATSRIASLSQVRCPSPWSWNEECRGRAARALGEHGCVSVERLQEYAWFVLPAALRRNGSPGRESRELVDQSFRLHQARPAARRGLHCPANGRD